MNDEKQMNQFVKVESRPLGVKSQNHDVLTRFYIYNIDSISYDIQDIILSYCISASVNQHIIQPETDGIVSITFHSDTVSGSFTGPQSDRIRHEKPRNYLIVRGLSRISDLVR